MATFHLCRVKRCYNSEGRVVFIAVRENDDEDLSYVNVDLHRVFDVQEDYLRLFDEPDEYSDYDGIINEICEPSHDIQSLIPRYIKENLTEKEIRQAKSFLSSLGKAVIDEDVIHSKSDSREDDYIMLRKYHLDERVIRIYYGNNSQRITSVEVED